MGLVYPGLYQQITRRSPSKSQYKSLRMEAFILTV